jgi:hypothetical protein
VVKRFNQQVFSKENTKCFPTISEFDFFFFHTYKLMLMLCIYSHQATCLAPQDNPLWTITCQPRLQVLHSKTYLCGPSALSNKKRKNLVLIFF